MGPGITSTVTPSPLLSTYVTTPSASGEYLGATTTVDLYKEKVTTYVNQRTNVKLSKESLAKEFTKKTANAFKLACAKLSFDETENQLKMPLMRQFGMMEISSGAGAGQGKKEEAKRGTALQRQFIDIPRQDDDKIRDLFLHQSDHELLMKVLTTNQPENRVIYDQKYLNELINSFSNQLLPITKERYVYTFEGYSKAFKAYTEDKYYT